MIDEKLHNLIKSKNKNTALCIGAIAVVMGVIRIILTRFYIEPEVHFYTDNSNFFVLSFDYITAGCIIAIYIASMFMYRYNKDDYKYLAASNAFVQGTQSQVFSASLTGFLLAASPVFQIYFLMKNDGLPLGERIGNYIKEFPFDFLLFFVAILCSVYFFKTAALSYDIGENEDDYENNGAKNNINKNNIDNIDINNSVNDLGIGNGINAVNQEAEQEREKENAKENGQADNKYSQFYIVLSFMPILWSFLNIFKCFFDMSKAVNSPVRIYELMCFLALSAYFVSESRMLVGRHKISRFFTFAYMAVILVAVSALPNLILSSFWILKTNSTQIIYAVELSFGLYIASRIYSQIRYSKFLLER